ncbi:MAG: PP2C family protein-serine/threonine phosphatase, partial [Rhodothermales bacterium]|nr:PP2C family protein-serine/threonine phosphatase [Rhodothermales bacterium]
LNTVADSTLRTRIGFDSAVAGAGTGADARVDRLAEFGTVTLGPDDIERMAVMHLARIAPGTLQMSLDTLTVAQGASGSTATVSFSTDRTVLGQSLQTSLTMTPTGNVSEISLEVNPDREEPVGTDASELLTIARVGGWGMLALIIIVVFFRRMIARLIDVKSAMLDAMLLGLMFGGATALAFQDWLLQTADVAIWVNILFRLLILSVVGGAAALLAFMVSGVGESLGREAFPRKMRTMSLMRHSDYRNQPVGAVLVRGIVGGGVLLGVCILAMTTTPDLEMNLDVLFASDYYMRPILAGIFNSMTAGYLVVLMVLVSLGAASTLLGDGKWYYLGAITFAGAVLQLIPVDLASSWWLLLHSGLFSLVLGILFLRYDAMTAFMAYATARLLVMLSEGVLIAGSPAGIDLLLGVLFLVTLVVIGAIGVASGRSERELQQYVPDYVTQMASQERVKRELELAHQVQASFLPRTMPLIEGLDIAGMCLPANEVGGDYFDFIQIDDDRLAFVVGDVSGKGIHAAFYMTLVKGILQTLSRESTSPADVMRRLNHLFCLNAPAGVFISMIYGVVDSRTGHFRFARAGHNPAILCRAGSHEAEFLQPAGMAIGFSDGERFDSNIEEATLTLRPGDALVFYTDGFSEAMNKSRTLYGDERLARKVGQIGTRSANAILRSVTEDVHHFIEGAGRSDDMT